jgi:beta-lactamase superfamily II metal-dependent hydrolase
MREVILQAISSYRIFFGDGIYLTLGIGAVTYLAVKGKGDQKKHFFLGFLLLFGFLYLCPFTAHVIMEYCIGKNVYWRMFWIVPVTVLIAYMFASMISRLGRKWQRCIAILGICLAIMQSGVFIYRENFSERQNRYKLYMEVPVICDLIEEDADKCGITEKGLIVVNDLASQIRQYDASIRMPYGRNALRNEKISKRASAIYAVMNSESLDVNTLAANAAGGKYQYLVFYKEAYREELKQAGYELIGDVGNYDLYRLDLERYRDTDLLITQYGQNDGQQMMCYMIRDSKNRLVMIDGGYETDAELLRERIKQLGGHVDAWILTHPHPDHIGAFYQIYKEPAGIVIDHIYTVAMAEPELCKENAPWDDITMYNNFLELDLPDQEQVEAGDVIECGKIKIKVLSAYEDKVDELSDDLINDGSMMFMVSGEKEKMLFCADVGKSMSSYLLEKYGDELKCDYIQMGHHGNGGLSKEFYKTASPGGAFFDAPEWLMNDSSGRYHTLENKELMEGMGCEILSFESAPNTIILK